MDLGPARRHDLHALLVELLGSENVYFQEPPTIQMEYPCIIYKRDDIDQRHANNKPYKNKVRYNVKVISRDPDNAIAPKVAQLPLCSFERFYTAEKLNHDVYNLYF